MASNIRTSRHVENLRRLAELAFADAGLACEEERPPTDDTDPGRPYQNIGGDNGLELLV